MSTQAFIEVSDIDHDILPRAVVELELDRQNCLLSQRFFSEDVQKILTRCNSCFWYGIGTKHVMKEVWQ